MDHTTTTDPAPDRNSCPTPITSQVRAWNGPEGSNWADHSAGRPPDGDLVAPLLDAAGLSRSDRVLDIGCGIGDLTLAAASQVSSGDAFGIDLSEEMIGRAADRAAQRGVANVRFQVGDAQVHPFEAGSRDVALSHFGAMFFDNPTAAFANIAHALQPSGRLHFVCPRAMSTCEWYQVPLTALMGRAPTPDSAPSAMFSLADSALIRRTLGAADFDDISITALDGEFWFGADTSEAADALVGSGPVRAFLERHPEVSRPAAHATLASALEPYDGENGVRLPGSHWLVAARQA